MNIMDPIFLLHVVSKILPMTSPSCGALCSLVDGLNIRVGVGYVASWLGFESLWKLGELLQP